MWELAISVLIPVVKWLFSRKAKRKLSDEEFVKYVLSHQKMRGRAGTAANEWEDALANTLSEMDKENKE